MATILVADDDRLVREALRASLQSGGHKVMEADNGKQAIDLCKSDQIDLVITNIVMPEIDGLEAIRILRDLYPSLSIIAITGYDPEAKMGYLALAQEYGAMKAFTKPFDVREMRKAVEELLHAG